MGKFLTDKQIKNYNNEGYLSPIDVMSDPVAAADRELADNNLDHILYHGAKQKRGY